jgi:lipopolysaccharide cholinephosphotransferase
VAKYLPNVAIHLVDGEEKNKKLTSPEDLPIFCQWLDLPAADSSKKIQPQGNFKQNLAEHNQKHLRQMQLKLVDILREITTLCDRHNIPYWLDSGTLLGAVRHGGFIPWDDDIDICVPVEDLPRLVEACRELPKHLSLQCPETEPQMRMPVYKVRDNNSLIVEAGDDFALSYEKGLFVDIFPMTAWPSFGAKFSRKVARGYCRANAILHAQHYYSLRSTAELFYFGMKRALFATLWKVGGWFCRKDKYYSNTLDNSGNGNRHLRTTVFPLTEIEFEGERFKAPANVDQYLKDLFRDYMALPPEEHRTGHAIFFKTHLD